MVLGWVWVVGVGSDTEKEEAQGGRREEVQGGRRRCGGH